MTKVAEFTEKPQFQAKKESLDEAKIVIDTIIDHFRFYEGIMDANLLWSYPDCHRIRVNWWNTQEGEIIKSSFVVVKRIKNKWKVTFAS